MSPRVALGPEGVTTSGLDLGDTLLGDSPLKEAKITVTNSSPFPISYSTAFVGPSAAGLAAAAAVAAPGVGTAGGGGVKGGGVGKGAPPPPAAAAGGGQSGAGGAAAAADLTTTTAPTAAVAAVITSPVVTTGVSTGLFICQPSQGTLGIGESHELRVVFNPKGIAGQGPGPASPYCADTLEVLVPFQRERQVVGVRGRCWDAGVYLAGPEYKPCGSSGVVGGGSSEGGGSQRQVVGRGGGGKGGLSAAGGGLGVFEMLERQIAAKAAAVTMQGSGGAAPASGAGGKGSTPAAAAGKGSGPSAVAGSGAQQQQSQQPRERLEGLLLLQPSPIRPGETAVASFEVGNVKTGSIAAAAGEVLLEELSPAAKAAGWSMEPPGGKITVAAGEKKLVTVKFTAPAEVAESRVAALGLPDREEVVIGCVVKGGALAVLGSRAALAMAADGTRHVLVRCVAKL